MSFSLQDITILSGNLDLINDSQIAMQSHCVKLDAEKTEISKEELGRASVLTVFRSFYL